MSNGKYALDEILEQSLSQQPIPRDDAALPNFCPYWPYIRQFLEWAKTQTNNFFVKLAIDAITKLGDQTCKQ